MRLALAALWLLLAPAGAWAEEPVALPPLTARVTDLTDTLAEGQRAELEAALAAIEQAKGAQVAILLLPSTRPETIEQFGIRLAEAWKVGRRGVNDGVIVIVARNDRKMRIEVGYGLEGAIPDAVAKRIVAEQMAPRFRQGDFHGGLVAAVAALGRAIEGEALPPPVGQVAGASGAVGDHGPVDEDSGFVGLFLVVIFAGMLRMLMGLFGSLLAAGIAGWLALALFGSWIAAAVAALVAFLFSFAKGGSGGGGLSGGDGGWSSSSDSGFSGGGGDFGGGGASGDW